MIELKYGTQLSPAPIKLSIGTLRKPKLKEIAEIGFDEFNLFETFAKMTPELWFTKIKGEDGKSFWCSLSEEERSKIALYDIMLSDKSLIDVYLSIFNFFFVEPVVFYEDNFLILDHTIEDLSGLTSDDIYGIISKESFIQVLEVIQRICCIYEKEQSADKMKFKNSLARKLYEKMLKAKQAEKKKSDDNMTLPNIISAVSNRHPSITPITVWELTIFQLLDSFERLRDNAFYEIEKTRVSVWGDEKKTFDAALWYKNNYDKK